MSPTSPIEPRIEMKQFGHIAPQIFAALRTMGQAIADSGLDKGMIELVKIRASQINGCAFCVQYHVNEAHKFGVPQAQLDQLAVWRDSPLFSEREAAALAWTEALCRMPQAHVEAAVYVQLQAAFNETEVVFLTSAIGHINAWNRICGPLLFAPPPAASAGTN